jgi:hypothetical protein
MMAQIYDDFWVMPIEAMNLDGFAAGQSMIPIRRLESQLVGHSL